MRRCDEDANKEDWDRESFSDDRRKRKFNQKGPVQYSTVQYSPLGPDTAQHSPVQYSLVQHSEVQYSFVKSSTAHYSLVKPSCSPIQPVIFLNIVLLVALSSLTELKPISF